MSSDKSKDDPATVGSRLLDEIERVTAKRERYREYAKTGLGNFLPAIAMMTLDIDSAKVAIARHDAPAAIKALHELQGYSSND